MQGEPLPPPVRACQQQLAAIRGRLAAGELDGLRVGGEPTFGSLSTLLSQMYLIVAEFQPEGDPEAVVAPVHREFLAKMLEKRSFNTMLVLVRESNALLKRARPRPPGDSAAALRPMLQWLEEHHVVKELLTVNMHQRQFVEAVQQLLMTLADAGALDTSVLVSLWGKLRQVCPFHRQDTITKRRYTLRQQPNLFWSLDVLRNSASAMCVVRQRARACVTTKTRHLNWLGELSELEARDRFVIVSFRCESMCRTASGTLSRTT